MTLIVEDGTIVAGANSFATVAYALDYLTSRGDSTFADAEQADQETALVRACDYLRDEILFSYRGQRIVHDQPLPWPRTGASIYRGPPIPENVVPKAIIDAQCELCFKALTSNIQPDITHSGGIASETIGPISTSYFKSVDPRVLITAVMGLLQPYVLVQGTLGLLPTVYHSDSSSLGDNYPFDPTNFLIDSLPDNTLSDES